MRAPMYRFARSRGLGALGLLAWLMMALGTLFSPPPGMAAPHPVGAHAERMPASALAADAHDCHAAAKASACCALQNHVHGAGTTQGCACQGVSAAALPSPSASLAVAAPVAEPCPRSGWARAPTPGTAPPLRPPLA